MKKIVKYLFVIFLSFCLTCKNVFAVDYSISLTSSSVTVGNSVTLKINGSGLTGRFNIASSNSSVASLSSSFVWVENNTQSITINTKSEGSAVITVTPDPGGVSDSNGYEPKLYSKTITITVRAKATTPSGGNNNGNTTVSRPKSSNSYLSSLTDK